MARGGSSCRTRLLAILLLLNLIVASTFFKHCDARSGRVVPVFNGKQKHSSKKLKRVKHLDLVSLLLQREIMDSSNSNSSPYVSSPFTLPPYDSLGPISIPDINSPPYCIYPPDTPLPPPSTPLPTPGAPPMFSFPPSLPIPGPPPGQLPPGGAVPGPPASIPSPPSGASFPAPPSGPTIGGPPVYIPSPPSGPTIGGPPVYIPSPPSGPTIGSPPYVFLPPIVYPPPAVPPPPRHAGMTTTWCVAKPAVPDPILEEAMDYACGSGADCEPIQPSGPCYEPNTYFAHASYAFNSYWQRTKLAGGSCSFGGVAILVTLDPSYDGCHFVYA